MTDHNFTRQGRLGVKPPPPIIGDHHGTALHCKTPPKPASNTHRNQPTTSKPHITTNQAPPIHRGKCQRLETLHPPPWRPHLERAFLAPRWSSTSDRATCPAMEAANATAQGALHPHRRGTRHHTSCIAVKATMPPHTGQSTSDESAARSVPLQPRTDPHGRRSAAFTMNMPPQQSRAIAASHKLPRQWHTNARRLPRGLPPKQESASPLAATGRR
jgi:hypothetical protein